MSFDILWHHSITHETQVWYMDGHRLVDRGTVLGLDGNPAFIGPPFSIVGIGDMNGNGKADIVWYNSVTGETQVWYMDGHQLVDRGTVLGLDGNPAFIGPPFSIVGTGDFGGGGFSRCNRLHIKVLTAPTNVSIATMLDRMREVYSTAGIRVDVVSREDLTPAVLGNAVFTSLNDLDVGSCQRGTASGEQNQLFQNQNHVAAGQRRNEVIVYFVQSVIATAGSNPGTLNGCASHPSGQPGVAIAQGASQWTLAHEVGHALGLNHIQGEHQGCPATMPQCCSTPDRTRLMTGCSTSNIIGTPTVNQGEISTMTGSNLTRAC
jgi:hypothetical protein